MGSVWAVDIFMTVTMAIPAYMPVVTPGKWARGPWISVPGSTYWNLQLRSWESCSYIHQGGGSGAQSH